jgi:crossover junction endodeoxyribonuclease RuvC
MAIILGIDPGSQITGFGVVEIAYKRMRHVTHGVIQLNSKDEFPLKMKELGEGLREILQKYQPQQVVIEKIFLGKNADSAFKLGHARGVAMYEAANQNCQVLEYATRVVKKGITGNGGASKDEVLSCLLRLLKIKAISRIDASDALALAVFQAYQVTNPLHRLTALREAAP